MTTPVDKIYVRPFGILQGQDAAQAVEGGFALPLAGGPSAFALVEILRLNRDGLQKRIVRVSDRDSVGRLIGDDNLDALTQSRPDINGLAMKRSQIMGVLNVTPDSFSDGGKFAEIEAAVAAGLEMAREGAAVIDVGGESTRPGAEPVDVGVEIERVTPVIEALVSKGLKNISIDSRNADVLAAAIDAGANMINDVSALSHDPKSMQVAADSGLPVILMHAQGEPQSMQRAPTYENVTLEVFDYLQARIEACVQAGIVREKIIVDPGIGFGKTLDHNLALLKSLTLFHGLGCPVLLGASRKTFIGRLDGDAEVNKRLPGSLAAAGAGLEQAVQFLRVHDVPEMRQFCAVSDAIDQSAPKF